MQLSTDPTTRQTQLSTIKSYVEANFSVNGSGVYEQSTADAMNLAASPDYVLWKNLVSLEEVGSALDGQNIADITSANSERTSVFFQVNPGGVVPFRADHRAFFDDAFSGAAGTETRDNLNGNGTGADGLWRRLATIAESILVASGTGSNGDPGVIGDGAEGDISLANLLEASNNG